MVTEQKDPLLSEAPAAPTVWRKARRDRLVVSVIVGLLIAIAVQMVFGKRNSHDVGGLFKGDFPAFFTEHSTISHLMEICS